jgi:hypothetical protein
MSVQKKYAAFAVTQLRISAQHIARIAAPG